MTSSLRSCSGSSTQMQGVGILPLASISKGMKGRILRTTRTRDVEEESESEGRQRCLREGWDLGVAIRNDEVRAWIRLSEDLGRRRRRR